MFEDFRLFHDFQDTVKIFETLDIVGDFWDISSSLTKL